MFPEQMSSLPCADTIVTSCINFWIHMIRSGTDTCENALISLERCFEDISDCQAPDLKQFSTVFKRKLQLGLVLVC